MNTFPESKEIQENVRYKMTSSTSFAFTTHEKEQRLSVLLKSGTNPSELISSQYNGEEEPKIGDIN